MPPLNSWVIAGFLACSATVSPARSEMPDRTVKIGVLTDLSGFGAGNSGAGSVAAARLAAEDAGPMLPGIKIEVIAADHQNKPDIGSAIARQWIERESVNAIVDVPNSAVALAVNGVVRGAPSTVYLNSGAGTSELTGKQCSPNTVQWTYDTWALANGTVRALLKRDAKSWFFITADYAFGHSLEDDATRILKAAGGAVLGDVQHPVATADFSSYLLEAQSSGAQMVALANASNDTVNSVKQAAEFGVGRGAQKLAALLIMLPDVDAIGLDAAQGLYLTEPFYWDLDAGTRAFSGRFAAAMDGRRPSMIQAGVYASLMHYFKALQAVGAVSATEIMRTIEAMPTDDPLFGHGAVRPDGRAIHDMHLFQIKTPAESKARWDYYKLLETIPAAEAFRPVGEGGCPLVAGH